MNGGFESAGQIDEFGSMMAANGRALGRLQHLLEGEEVGFDGDGEMRGSAEDVDGPLVRHVLEVLTVDLQDLVAALETRLVGFGTPLHAGHENPVATIPTTWREEEEEEGGNN